MATTTNPFTLIHSTLWSALIDYDDWADLVTGRSRVRLDQGEPHPSRFDGNIQAGDTPVVKLEQGRFQLDLSECDGQSVKGLLRFPLVVVGKSLDVLPVNEVKWQTLRALVNVGHYLGMPNLVRMTWVEDAKDTNEPNKRDAQGSSRMAAYLDIVVHVHMTNAQVLAGSIPND